MAPLLLNLDNIRKSFGAIRALKGVSLELREGEVHALLGENGAGKSTLIKVITGAQRPDGGTISIGGERIDYLTPASARKLGIAAVYQQPALFPDLTVAENIALALESPNSWRFVNWKERRRRAIRLLLQVGAAVDPDTEACRLSMPEQQLVEIAKALGSGARILILDEPTASLTQKEVDLLHAVIRDLRSRGAGILYISHRLHEIFALADRVTVLRDGESAGAALTADIDEASLVRLMVGREISSIYPEAEQPPGGVVLSVKQLTCRESNIRGVTFQVRAGEVFGIAGLIGAGRTELARAIFGITPLDSGEITICGQVAGIRSAREAIGRRIAYVPEDRRQHGVVLQMSIASNITMALHPRIFPSGFVRLKPERDLANNYMAALAVKAPSPDAVCGDLSGGNQQKVALARWLAIEPEVLILDEPTQGVDVGAKAEIHKIIRQIAAKGVALILISSDLPEVVGMSDRIGVMRGGEMACILSSAEADADSIMAAALPSNGRPARE